jgi:ADP-heptose:LPS heptosyltransferase
MVIDSHHDQNNWPTENFIEIIKKLIKKNLIYINFSPNKKYLLENFPLEIRKSKNIEFTYKKKISEIIDIIYSCNIVIGNETGPICFGLCFTKKNSCYLYASPYIA